ncbi:MAG: four helix bundle protein [Fluviicola sp.]|nr:four helix bundle protein [Fluviicola sp.]
MSINSYKDLLIWQKGIDLAVDVYSLTRDFPETEKFALTSQIKRSASSISANIAEGYGRQSSKSYSQFIKISRGSLFELETHLILAERLNFIAEKELYDKIKNQIIEEGKMLNSFIKKLDNKQ